MGAAFVWDSVEEINVKDDYTVEFKLSYPALDLIASGSYAAFIMSPNAVEQNSDWFNAGNAAGTGPYKFKNYKGEEVIFTKFDEYWGGWKDNQYTDIIIKKSLKVRQEDNCWKKEMHRLQLHFRLLT